MIESTARAERFDLQTSVSPGFLWEVPQKPVAVRIPFNVIDRLEREAVEAFRSLSSRGSEIGGLLVGDVTTDNPLMVSIADYELIACDYARGPLYRLAEADMERFQKAIQQRKGGPGQVVAGFFRSHTRKGIALDADDLAFYQACFRDPHHVALLVRPFATKASTAGIFIWENGKIHGEASYREFPFHAAELGGTASEAPAPEAKAPVQAPAPPAPAKPPVRAQIVPISRREEPAAPAAAAPPPPAPATSATPAAEPPKVEEKFSAAKVDDRLVRKDNPTEPVKAAAPAPVKPAPAPVAPVAPVKISVPSMPAKVSAPAVTPAAPANSSPAVTPAAPANSSLAATPAAPAKSSLAATPAAPTKSSPAATPAAPAKPMAPASPARALDKTEKAAETPIEKKIEKPAETQAKGGKGLKLVMAAAAAIALFVGLFVYPGFLRHNSKTPAAATGGDSSPLQLRVERSSGQLLLTWNRDTDAIRNATKATLLITDGEQHENVDMDLSQLRENGSIVYSPTSADVSFKMEVIGKDQSKTTSESVRILRTRPSPLETQQAETKPAAPVVPTQTPALTPALTPVPTQGQTPKTAANDKPAAAAPAEEQPVPEAPKPVVARREFNAASLSARIRPASPTDIPDAPTVGGAGSAAIPGVNLPVGTVPGAPAAPSLVRPTAPAPPVGAANPGVKQGGNIQSAVLITRKEPEYPKIAKQTGAKGIVKLSATVGKDGHIKSVRVLSGHPMLQAAAVEAVKQWIYRPTLLNGTPVETETEIQLNFVGER